MPADDWNPELYDQFKELRLIPALHLLAAVPSLPEGPIVDLGCGTGTAAEALRACFPDQELIGVDRSFKMLRSAAGLYDRTERADISEWHSHAAPSLVFSNAVLHWLPNHSELIPHLVKQTCPGGMLAVQMPCQFQEPSHQLLRDLAEKLWPDRFDFSAWKAPVGTPESYIDLGATRVWETVYQQVLPKAPTGHPVRHFTESTAARPIIAKLSADEADALRMAYDGALVTSYPLRVDGSAIMPFRRVFMLFENRG